MIALKQQPMNLYGSPSSTNLVSYHRKRKNNIAYWRVECLGNGDHGAGDGFVLRTYWSPALASTMILGFGEKYDCPGVVGMARTCSMGGMKTWCSQVLVLDVR